MNEIVDRLWLKTREHIGDLLDHAEQALSTMQGLVQRAETAAETAVDIAERGAPDGGWPAEDLGPHEHPQSQVIGLGTTLSGKADLVGGHVPTSQIPALALTKPFVVQNRAGMLALDAQEGDVAVIQGGDDQGTYMLGDGPSGVFGSWVALASSVDVPVQSVNGQVGTVVLNAANVGASPTSHTHTPQALGAAPASHEHTVAQISNLPAITSDATGGALVQRFSDGNITTTLPAGNYNVTPKIYVDRRPALFSGAGGPPSTITGAVVGDWWLDETSMEIHKITGV